MSGEAADASTPVVGDCSHLAMSGDVGNAPLHEESPLYVGPVSLRLPNNRRRGSGEVRFEYLPRPRVAFEVELERPLPFHPEPITIRLFGPRRWAKANITGVRSPGGTTHGAWLTAGVLQSHPAMEYGRSEPIGRVRFRVLNFRDYHGDLVHLARANEHLTWAGRVSFAFGQWQVTLDSVPTHRKRWQEAKAAAGYAVTHIGNLARRDNKLFRGRDACRALEFLYWFLSFANGARCACVLPRGYRTLGYPVWELWRADEVSRAAYYPTWFSEYQPVECLKAAEGAYACWRNEESRDWLVLAISLYLEANSSGTGMELSLAHAQMALELLSWVVLTETNRAVSEDGFEKLSAADKIRLLLFQCSVRTEIPPNSPDLRRAYPTADGPDAITEIRNSLIHPNRSRRKKLDKLSHRAKWEAWQLAVYYVEMALLRSIQYRGPHVDRSRGLNDRTPIPVPWAA